MSDRARSVIQAIDAAEECVIAWPVAAARLSRKGASCLEMIFAGASWDDINREDGHIRRRANENRKRNKAARAARRLNRSAA